MPIALTHLNQITTAIYKIAGEPVIYTPVVGAPLSVSVLITRDSQLFGRTVGADYADTADTARIQKNDILRPARGDTITDADSVVYTVENVDDNFNDSEHEVELRRTA